MKETNWTNINGKQNGSITSYHNDGTLHFTETWVVLAKKIKCFSLKLYYFK